MNSRKTTVDVSTNTQISLLKRWKRIAIANIKRLRIKKGKKYEKVEVRPKEKSSSPKSEKQAQ